MNAVEIISLTDKNNFVIVVSLIIIIFAGGLMVWITKKIVNYVLTILSEKISEICDGVRLNVRGIKENSSMNQKSLVLLDKLVESVEKNTRIQDDIRKALNGRSNLGQRVERIERTLNHRLQKIEDKL